MTAPTLPIRFFTALALAAASLAPAAAQTAQTAQTVQTTLYTWKDAQGQTFIKNSPPPWYDDSGWTRGPRVQVLRNNKIVDDTAWSAERRQDARNKATTEEIKRMQAVSSAAAARKGEKNDE